MTLKWFCFVLSKKSCPRHFGGDAGEPTSQDKGVTLDLGGVFWSFALFRSSAIN
jgi:hypothetical protein